jgi:hypothetical protein
MDKLVKLLSDGDLHLELQKMKLLRQFMLAHTPELMGANDNDKQ